MLLSLFRQARPRILQIVLSATVLVSSLCPLDAGADVLSFSYDDAGRLVQAQGSAGTTEYHYDAAGNLINIVAPVANAVTISEFSPSSGVVGEQITLIGTGFSSTLTNNVVKFNGVAATVSGATTTSLTVTVPTGATTGPVSVTIAGQAGVSLDAFTVVASDPNGLLTINPVTQSIAAIGSTYTLTGSNIGGAGADLWVRVGGVDAQITSASAGQISFTVPSGIQSGDVVVGSRQGSVVAGTLYMPSSDIASKFAGGVTAVVNGPSQTVNLGANQVGYFVFPALANKDYTVQYSTNISQNGRLMFYLPDGSIYSSALFVGGSRGTVRSFAVGNAVVVLDATGIATASATSMSVTTDTTPSSGFLIADASSLTLKGAAAPASMREVSFEILPNQSLDLAVVAAGSGSAQVNVVAADGSATVGVCSVLSVNSDCMLEFQSNAFLSGDVPAGIYTVQIVPQSSTTAVPDVTLTLSNSVNGVLNMSAPQTVNTTRLGQHIHLAIPGTQGGGFQLQATALTTTPSDSGLLMRLFPPSGGPAVNSAAGSTLLDGGILYASSLPETGNYVLDLVPSSKAATLSTTLTYNPIPTIQIDGPTVSANGAGAGRAATLFFAGTAGQYVSAGVTGSTLDLTVKVFAPDGSGLPNVTCLTANGGCVLEIGKLPQTGTYVMQLVPSGAQTLSASVTLSQHRNGTLTTGTQSVVLDRPGVVKLLSFSGTIGQVLVLDTSILSDSPSGNNVIDLNLVRVSDGASIASTKLYAANGGGLWQLDPLPTTDSYQLIVGVEYGAVATLSLALNPPADLTVGGAPITVTNTVAGLGKTLTFSAAKGMGFAISQSNVSVTGTGYGVSRTIYDPQGAVVPTTFLCANGNCTLIVPYVAQSGTYTFQLVAAANSVLATGTFALLADLATPVTLDGASVSVSAPNPNLLTYFSFSANAGQNVGIGLSGLTLAPAASARYANITVYAPDGTQISSSEPNAPGSSYSGPGKQQSSCFPANGCAFNFPNLPQTGTYQVRVSMDSPSSSLATITATVSQSLTGTLSIGLPRTLTFNRPGQRARLSINAAKGDLIQLQATQLNIQPAGGNVDLALSSPSGGWLATVSANSVSGGAMLSITAPATGTYILDVDPDYVSTASLIVTLDPQAQILPNAAPTNVGSATAGQGQLVTFYGSAGENLGIGLDNIVVTGGTSPIPNFTYTVFQPDGTQIYFSPQARLDQPSYQNSSCTIVPPWRCGLNLNNLKQSGVYSIMLQPQYGAVLGNVRVTVSDDNVLPLYVNGPYVPFNSGTPGKNSRFTFTGIAGGSYVLNWSGSTFAGPVQIDIYGPDGKWIAPSVPLSQGATSAQYNTVALSGTYTVFVDPTATDIGQITLWVTGDKAAPPPPTADIPLPPWALGLLAIALSAAAVRKRHGFTQGVER